MRVEKKVKTPDPLFTCPDVEKVLAVTFIDI